MDTTKQRIKFWMIIVTVNAVVTTSIYFCFAFWLPHARTINVQADAVAVANTYIVLTTMIVTGFAALVALVSFYLAQHTNDMKMRELEDAFEKHLNSDSKFIKNLQKMAKERIVTAIDEFEKGDEYKGFVDKLLKHAQDKASENSNQMAAAASLLKSTKKK